MNFSQYAGILRILVPGAISFAVGRGWVTQDVVSQVGIALATIVASGGWSAAANTTLSLSKAVAAVPGLQVHVDEKAPSELQEAAINRAVPDIVPAKTGLPLSTTPSQRRYP
jgi:hypothetical protein